jgi:hypothetical protein
MKLYPLFIGEYSDMSLVAIFTEDGKATASADAERIGMWWGDPLNLDEWKRQMPPAGQGPYNVEMSRDGVVTKVCQAGYLWEPDGRIPAHWQVRSEQYRKSYPDKWLSVRCFARDTKHAVKIASDVRRAILAGVVQGDWGNLEDLTEQESSG